MALEDFIDAKLQKNQNTEVVTIRIPSSLLGDIDDLSATVNTTRTEFLLEVISDGTKRALDHYRRVKDVPDMDFFMTTTETQRFFILNTNKRNNESDHLAMVRGGFAAAFYDPWNLYIDRLKKGDCVFLYESGIGIVATGNANGECEVEDYENPGDRVTHKQRLSNYQRVEPMSARQIKKLTGVNMVFMKTMFEIDQDHGERILQNLTARKFTQKT